VSDVKTTSRGFDAARFQPGVSGNPGGAANTAVVRAIARRYAPDALRTLVEIARIPSWAQASARALASRTLLEIGFTGIFKGDADEGERSAMHMHMLAVMNAPDPLGNLQPTGQPAPPQAPEGPEIATEMVTIDLDLLPEPNDDLPGAPMPLWDAYKARKRAAAEAEQAKGADDAQSGEHGTPEGTDRPENPG
jgi:hypothetical protein